MPRAANASRVVTSAPPAATPPCRRRWPIAWAEHDSDLPWHLPETITIGRPLTLIGAGQGTGAGDTILQGNGASVVTINPGVGPVTLQTLRITGGTAGPVAAAGCITKARH